ncbi:hypothetical protein [Microbacterium immunditiarum]|uniref:Uncharacterized protein n=1 Tax=Microbacterium immunditiarum TaxID=337480 RepID=A0A7Y9KM66_9MICO|nr:hypothetical protein [Microbacterium immunditiarum]NYE20499.1 hypothetical protein [Microbacterium immunditiarum]
MDVVGWIVLGGLVVGAIALVALAPRLQRDNLRRQLEGGGGSLAGIGGGLDAVWRPSAEEAHAQWEAQVEMPAPAPTPGDGYLDGGTIVISVDRPVAQD